MHNWERREGKFIIEIIWPGNTRITLGRSPFSGSDLYLPLKEDKDVRPTLKTAHPKDKDKESQGPEQL